MNNLIENSNSKIEINLICLVDNKRQPYDNKDFFLKYDKNYFEINNIYFPILYNDYENKIKYFELFYNYLEVISSIDKEHFIKKIVFIDKIGFMEIFLMC